MEPMNNPLYQNIGDELALGTLEHIDVIQSLWGGYGELVRLTFLDRSVIVKHVKLPRPSQHPRGWNTDRSHQRKLHSYQVEVSWYQHFSQPVDERCRIPQGLKCFQNETEWLIVMEDLALAGYPNVVKDATKGQLKACLTWLANFHARHIGVRHDELWQTGTYWHLQTRPDELVALQDNRLKQRAESIDQTLRQARFQTLVHGDAKLANFCFNEQGSAAAAVDFQYVGHGCAMKDVALFMSSAIEPSQCTEMESWVLDNYFSALTNALNHYQPDLDNNVVEQEWRPLFALAWADFQRFVKGWSPEHWKINPYTESLTKRALDELDLGSHQ
ncbi:phosphotransferase [Vibrio harveyi]|uniref:phosphotransferase n=1 Tax=Vibrio TaxID=662 RepID=UPI0012632DFD|nr:phosphotransferase [Vibrio harveyi]ELI0634301.1 phosphotransferase [Vibrio harveyi]ELV8721131.1 phosphotransferase [Vibrio harveyi]QFQ81363.1 phosphotransferase [Vibrio harveyi]WJT10812.1 phosphotransferase [Vibrio harveyi]HEQ3586190.1 phosphotransferase [Vibrio harveyi]